MATETHDRFRSAAIVFLLAVIIIGGLVVWSKYQPGQPVEIRLAPRPELQGQIYAGGAVNNPGSYPLREGDSLQDIIQAAGGTAADADLSRLRLFIPPIAETETPQKVNLNHAGSWLLQALPGIGAARAQAIIDYRLQHGPFRSTSELTSVAGIGSDTYDKIKDLVTVDTCPE